MKEADGRTLSASLGDAANGLFGCVAEAKTIYNGISGSEAVKEAAADIGVKGKGTMPNNLLDQAACLAEEIGQLQEWLQSIRADLGLSGPGPVNSEK